MMWLKFCTYLTLVGYFFALGECVFPPTFTYWGTNGSSVSSAWPTLFPNYCNQTTRQSPIAITYSGATYSSSLSSSIGNFSSGSSGGGNLDVTDDGVKVHVGFANSFQWSGLGTSNTWVVDHVHLHWGSTDSQGSEHTLDGLQYPFEVHIVTYSSAYPNFTAALKGSDSIGVLGVFGQISSSDNAALADFFSLDVNASTPNVFAEKESSLTPWSFLPSTVTSGKTGLRYYRYYGSLTTPTCDEVVVWTMFADPLYVSAAQLNVLRAMKYYANDTATTHQMVNNYRSVQSLNGRTVSRSFATTSSSVVVVGTSTSTSNMAPASTFHASVATAALNAIGALASLLLVRLASHS